MKKILLALVILIVSVIAAVAVLIVSDVFNTQFEDIEKAQSFTAEVVEPFSPGKTLKVMTYNIKFGGARIDMFFDCHGDREIMTKEEVLSNMQALADKINEVDPDVLFVQEIDINSTRSGDVDQVSFLLENTHLNYAVYGSQWKSTWIPTHDLGHINSGNAIFSKLPLQEGKRTSLRLFDSQDFVTRYFYLKRNLLTASIELNGTKVELLGTHLSAYAKDDTKQQQLKTLHATLKAYQDRPFIMGGDLNSLPPHTVQMKDFDDDACKEGDFAGTDHSDYALELQPLYDDFTSAISLELYKQDNRPFFSFTSDKTKFFNRKLDYLFTNQVFSDGKVLQDTMPLSDHAPEVVTFSLK